MSCIQYEWASIEGSVDATIVSVKPSSSHSGECVREAEREIQMLARSIPPLRGDVALIEKCSPPVVGAVVSCLRDWFKDVAVVDPELNGYVVVRSSGGRYKVGDVIPEESVHRPPYVL